MLSCKDATRLASERLDHPLPLGRRMGLWLHLRMCRHCATFEGQLRYLRQVMRRSDANMEQGGADALPKEAAARIKAALRSKP